MYKTIKKAVLLSASVASVFPVHAGGRMSKGLGAVVVGVATGGVGLAVGAPLMAAATAGAAAAAGVASNGRVRSGVRINPTTRQITSQVNVSTSRGVPVASINAGPRGINAQGGSSTTSGNVGGVSFAEATRIASSKFTGWSSNTAYSLIRVNGSEYCRAKNSNEDFLSLSVSRGWSKTDRELIGTQRFENQPWNLTFETTPYQWYFEDVWLEGKTYVHAYSDSLIDFMVPKTERHTICAPKSFVEQYKLEQENKKKQDSLYATLSEKKAAAKKAEDHSTEFAKAFFDDSQHSIYGAAYYARQCQINREREAESINMARKLAQGAVEYYQAAVNVAESVNLGPLTEAAVAFLLPGGIENVQNFASGSIGIVDFLSNIGRDIGQDVAVSLVTSGFGGFSNRLKKATLRTASTAVEKVSKTPMKTVAASRVTRVFGMGRYWESLFKRTSNTKWGQQANKYCSRTNKKIRFDNKGYAYQFDLAHKTDKVHLHKYKSIGGDKFKLIEEIDPETGELLRIVKDGRIEQW